MSKFRLILLIICSSIIWNSFTLPFSQSNYNVVSRYPVSISPDGRYIATDAYDGTSRSIYVFEPPNSNPVWSKGWIHPCYYSFSSDGKYLAVGGETRARVYDWGNDTLMWQSSKLSKYTLPVSLSANGNYLAIGGEDGVYLFDIADNSLIQLWSENHESSAVYYVDSVSISPEGDYIAASVKMAENAGAYIYKRGDNDSVWHYYRDIYSVSLSENGRYITVLDHGSFYQAHVFTRDDNTPIWSYSGVRDAVMSSDGNYIAVVVGTKVALFSREENTPLWSYSLGDTDKYISAYISISANGSYVAAAVSESGEVVDLYLFSRAGGAPIWSHSFRTPWYQNPVVIASLIAVVLVAGMLILVKRRRGLKRTKRRRARSARIKQRKKS